MAERKQVPIGLRLPIDLAHWLKSQAETNRRSVANQAAFLIDQARKEQEAHAKTTA